MSYSHPSPRFPVIPAKAGISGDGTGKEGKEPHEIPAFAGMTGVVA